MRERGVKEEGGSERERERADGELIRVGILPATLHAGLLLVAV